MSSEQQGPDKVVFAISCSFPTVFFFVVIMFIPIIPIVVIYGNKPETKPCITGSFLRPNEQMWCESENSIVVVAELRGNETPLYRLKKSDPTTIRTSHIDETVWSKNYTGKTYSLVYSLKLMRGSTIVGTMDSSSYHTCSFRRGSYKVISEGVRSVFVNYTVTESDEYNFYVDSGFSEPLKLNVDVNYKLYDVSSKKPASCSRYDTCEFWSVKSDEVIVADNPFKNSSSVTLDIATNRETWLLAVLILIPCIVAVIYVIIAVKCWISCWKDEVKKYQSKAKETQEKETKPTQETPSEPNETPSGYGPNETPSGYGPNETPSGYGPNETPMDDVSNF